MFPATRFYRDPVTGLRRRHHLHESVLQKAMKRSVEVAGLAKPATCHTLRARCAFSTGQVKPVALYQNTQTAAGGRSGQEEARERSAIINDQCKIHRSIPDSAERTTQPVDVLLSGYAELDNSS